MAEKRCFTKAYMPEPVKNKFKKKYGERGMSGRILEMVQADLRGDLQITYRQKK